MNVLSERERKPRPQVGRRVRVSQQLPYEEKVSQRVEILKDPTVDVRDRRLARQWLMKQGHADLVPEDALVPTQPAKKPAAQTRPSEAARAELIPVPHARSLTQPELAVRVENRRAIVCDLGEHCDKTCGCFDEQGRQISF